MTFDLEAQPAEKGSTAMGCLVALVLVVVLPWLILLTAGVVVLWVTR